MRWLLFSDLHLRLESQKVCEQVLARITSEIKLLKPDRVAFLGDWWHAVQDIPASLLEMTRHWLDHILETHGEPVRMLVGNHDREAQGIDALRVYERHGEIIHQPTIDEHGIWIPWAPKEALSKWIAQQALGDHPSKTIFGHFALKGAMMNDLKPDDTGLDLENAPAGMTLLLGHYHKPHSLTSSKKTEAHYIGSPWQTRADEAGQPKGYAIWDSEDRKLTRFVFHIGPKYVRLTSTVAGEMDLHGVTPESKVRVVAPDEAAATSARKVLASLGVKDFVVVPKQVLAAGAQASIMAPNLAGFMTAYASKKIGDEAARADVLALVTELSEGAL